MRRNNLGYYLREGVRSIFLHGFMSFAAVCVIIACLIIMGSFSLVLLNLNNMIREEEQKNEIRVFIDENLSESEAKSVGSQINLIPNVLSATFVSRDQALSDYVAEQDDPSIFDGIDASTFRDRYEVQLVDISQMEQTVTEIEQLDGVAKVSAHFEISHGFTTLQNILNVASIAIIAVLLVVTLLIISNTVKLALIDRKEEISIMKMVGATNGFIRWPFVVEGFLLGTAGAAGGFFLEWVLYDFVASRIEQADTMHLLEMLPFTDWLWPIAGAFAIVGFLVGVVGSLLSIRKFLNV